MRKRQLRAALILAVIFLGCSAAACSREDFYGFLQQELEWEELFDSSEQQDSKESVKEGRENSKEAVKESQENSKETEKTGEKPAKDKADRDSGQVAKDANKSQAEPKQAEVKEAEPPEQISTGKYSYEQLSETEQRVYDEMLSAILNHDKAVRLSTKDSEEMYRAYKAVNCDYGGLFWTDGYVFTQYKRGDEPMCLLFAPKYTMDIEKRRKLQKRIDEIVEAWLAGISINDSDYDKAKYVFEILALNTEYVKDSKDNQNIISVFLRQQTVCQGYASAVQYLLEQLGVQSVIVSGESRGEPHAWNLVCLDGEYYYMDATWGNNGYKDKEGQKSFFLDYDYMTMTTEEMLLQHKPDSDLIMPECTAVLNNYYIKEGNYIENWEPDLIGEKLAQAWEAKRVLTLRFSDIALRDQAYQYFIEDGYIWDYCKELDTINYIRDDTWKEISFCFNVE